MTRARSSARRCVVQALYQLQLRDGSDAGGLADEFANSWGLGRADADYFQRLVRGIAADRDHLDSRIAPFLDRPAKHLDPVERAVLWLGAFEMEYCAEVPYRVVLNEAVELAKAFGAEQGHTLVNAVLDRLAAQLRATEQPS